MSHTCPKCKERYLSPIQAVPPTATRAWTCKGCQGIWVPHEALDHLSTSEVLYEIDSIPSERPEQDRRTGLCPEGHGILKRARMAWEEPYFLERCSHCHGLWFDAGEWTRVASQSLLDDVSHLWTSTYRRRITEESTTRLRRADLLEKFGEELFTELDVLSKRLRDSPLRSAALAFLIEESRT